MRCLMILFLAAGLAGSAMTLAGIDPTSQIDDRITPAPGGQLTPPWPPAPSLSEAVQPQPVLPVPVPLSLLVTGARFQYVVRPGDYLAKISARFGVSGEALVRENGLSNAPPLKPGETIWIDNRHIVPDVDGDGLYVNLPQRMLYYLQDGELLAAYPVGIGKPSWPTPMGKFTLIEKVKEKTWLVPVSIQEEMRRHGQVVRTSVPPGPDNPLGKHWLGLSIPAIGIHGTIVPTSIYKFQSHGCIRLHPDDIEVLFEKVERGVSGQMLYQPVLLAEAEGRIYLEVHRDIYGKGGTTFKALNQMASDVGIAERIDWSLAADVFAKADGVARDVTLRLD